MYLVKNRCTWNSQSAGLSVSRSALASTSAVFMEKQKVQKMNRLRITCQALTCWWWPLMQFTRGKRRRIQSILPSATVLDSVGQGGGWTEKWKTWITFLACFNADGIEKVPLLIIFSALYPSTFNKKSWQELGLDYHANNYEFYIKTRGWIPHCSFCGFSVWINESATKKDGKLYWSYTTAVCMVKPIHFHICVILL